MTAPANLPEWLRPDQAATAVAPRVIRVAVLARNSTDDQQEPALSIPRQYGNCERALLPNMQITRSSTTSRPLARNSANAAAAPPGASSTSRSAATAASTTYSPRPTPPAAGSTW